MKDDSGTGITGDAGVLYQMADGRVRVGLVGRNLLGKVKYTGGADAFERSFAAGVAFKPTDKILLAADAEYKNGVSARAGAEYRIGRVALRAGGALRNEDVSITAGAGFAMGNFTVDYAYETHKVLPDCHRFSLSLEF